MGEAIPTPANYANTSRRAVPVPNTAECSSPAEDAAAMAATAAPVSNPGAKYSTTTAADPGPSPQVGAGTASKCRTSGAAFTTWTSSTNGHTCRARDTATVNDPGYPPRSTSTTAGSNSTPTCYCFTSTADWRIWRYSTAPEMAANASAAGLASVAFRLASSPGWPERQGTELVIRRPTSAHFYSRIHHSENCHAKFREAVHWHDSYATDSFDY